PSFNFGFELPGRTNNIGKERSASLAQVFENLLPDSAQPLAVAGAVVRRHPVRIFADEESDRGYAGRNHPATTVSIRSLECRRMRRQPSPSDRTGEAELIKPLGIVIGNTMREYVTLPGVSGNFKTLQLADNFESGAFALQLGSGRNVLPAQ